MRQIKRIENILTRTQIKYENQGDLEQLLYQKQQKLMSLR